METFRTTSAAATVALGRNLARRFSAGDCVAITGPLGAGKTVLARGIAVGLGLEDERLVSSPTFVLVQEYPARIPVYHIDLYRLPPGAAGLEELGFEEMLDSGVVLIEWAERAEGALPRPHWRIEIEVCGKRSRRLHLRRIGEESSQAIS